MTDEEKKALEERRAQERERVRVEVEQRKALGRQKKLWCITVYYETKDNAAGAHRIDNRMHSEMIQIREHLFSAGLMLPLSPGQWIVVPPWRMTMVTVDRQNTFFDV